MTRAASMSGRNNNQNAAAKWAAWVQSDFGRERSSRPRAIRSISASDEKYSMTAAPGLIENPAELNKTPPMAGFAGLFRGFQTVRSGVRNERVQPPPLQA